MGIITGIGDKSTNTNLITPKIDADVYNFILNKNCIIDGLEVVGNTLTAGVCVLKGYRGILENAETLNNETYIYGKFTLNFNNDITDEFEIVKRNSIPQDGTVNPETITTAGIYYLLLYTYVGGSYHINSSLDNSHKYPLNAYTADETSVVRNGAIIGRYVTTPTAAKNAHLTEPFRVANTEYVHNQIDEEIAYNTQTITVNKSSSGYIYNNTLTGTITLKHKAKYVIGNASLTCSMTQQGNISGVLGTANEIFIPTSQKIGILRLSGTSAHEGTTVAITDYFRIAINTNGEISLIDNIPPAYISNQYTSSILCFGYETN